MARKRFAFLCTVEWVLKGVRVSVGCILRRGVYRRVLAFSLLSLFLTVGMPPVLSQMPLANSTAQSMTEAPALVRQGRQYYDEGKFDEAVSVLEQAAKDFEDPGEELKRAITLGNLSLAYQQLGKWADAEQAIAESLKLLGFNPRNIQTRLIPNFSTEVLRILAPVLDIYGRFWYVRGQPEVALYSWRLATDIYHERLDDTKGRIGSQINQVQALQALGLYQQSQERIEEVQQDIQQLPESFQAKGLLSLGDVLRAVGNLEKSRHVLQESLEKANSAQDIGAALLSLGNTLRALGNLARDRQNIKYESEILSLSCLEKPDEGKRDDSTVAQFYQRAAKCYQEAAAKTQLSSSATGIQSKLNLLSVSIETQKWLEDLLDIKTRSEPQEPEVIKAIKLQIESHKKNIITQLNELPSLLAQLAQLQGSQTAVYTRINLAQSLLRLQTIKILDTPSPSESANILALAIEIQKDKIDCDRQVDSDEQLAYSWKKSAQLLSTAVKEAECLDSQQAKSYALGKFGQLLYELLVQTDDHAQQNLRTQLTQNAKKLTEKALLLTQPSKAPHLAYQWQWQLGRLFEVQENREEAIAAYEAAVKTLESVRSDLLTVNSDFQFSFRDNVEPVYRELVNLLLQPGKYQNLDKARSFINELQLAELQNFLQCNLQKNQRSSVDELVNQDNSTALIYPIILKDRLEVIIKLPGQPPTKIDNPLEITQSEFEETINQLRFKLEEDPFDEKTGKYLSKQVYDWLIGNAEQNSILEPRKIKTLVFVLDGSLRNIPMAALYDGKQYLIEKYAVAMSIGLELPTSKQKIDFKALIAGQSQASQFLGLSELSHVGGDEGEVNQIKRILEASHIKDYHVLLDKDLNSTTLKDEVSSSPYTVIHLATHGQFSSDPRETFIITAPNEKITFTELDDLFRTRNRESVELLVLSACETAEGDKRATLGIAGVTVQAGVRSTLGTLWNVDDASTAKLMAKFYQELSNNQELGDNRITAAEALRKAQVALIQEREKEYDTARYSPFHWAPYIIVGNWKINLNS